MTNIAFVLSVLLGVGSLSWGYASEGLVRDARWILVFGAVWLIAKWRGWKWMHSLAFLIVMFASAFGLWIGLAFGWMVLGSVGGLLAWDLADFSRRLSYASPTDDVAGMERGHILRVGVVTVFGAFLASIALIVHLQLKFELIIGLVIFAVIGIVRLVIALNRD